MAQPIHDQASGYCHTGPLPLLMTGVLRNILIEHFADRDNVAEPALRGHARAPDAPGSVRVESADTWTPASAASLPAVVIRRGPWRPRRLGIDDKFQGGARRDGFDRYAQLMEGSHRLFCLHKTGAAAELLGSEVAMHLMHNGPELRRQLRLHRLALEGVGALVELEDAPESFAVPVTLAYAFEESWVLRAEAPPLRRVALGLDPAGS